MSGGGNDDHDDDCVSDIHPTRTHIPYFQQSLLLSPFFKCNAVTVEIQ